MPECSIEIQGNMSKSSKPSTLKENSKKNFQRSYPAFLAFPWQRYSADVT